MKKVSVILTTYNSEDQLEEVINSINNQKGRGELFEIELLVVDDCSIDNTKQKPSLQRFQLSKQQRNLFYYKRICKLTNRF